MSHTHRFEVSFYWWILFHQLTRCSLWFHKKKVSVLLDLISHSNTHSMALAVKNESSHRPASNAPNRSGHNSTHKSATGNVNWNPSRGWPFCTHCNYLGHNVETCYKLHGYPPEYRQRKKPTSHNNQSTHVNRISNTDGVADHANTVSDNFLQNLNNSQCQQLMSFLSSHLSSAAKIHDPSDIPSTSSICSSIFLNQPFVSCHI